MTMDKRPAVYIMASGRNGTLYVGVTSDLVARVHAHRSGESGGFAARYRCVALVYYELYDEMTPAILREKQLKAGSRAKKLARIKALNPTWRDLFDDIACP
ncbi:MAG: GIY-YIG nuclease family protein [Maricaulaceae bacterium]